MAEKKKKRRKRRVANGKLTQLKNGSWQGRVCIGRDENGPMYQTITKKSKAEAEVELLRLRGIYATTPLNARSRMTFEEWATIWIDEIKSHLIGESTYHSYKSMIDTHLIPRLGTKQLLVIKPSDIKRAIGDMQTKKSPEANKVLALPTVKVCYMILNQIFEAAIATKLLIENPAADITFPKKKRKEKAVLTVEQLKIFFNTVNTVAPEWYDVYYVELMTGLRRGELFGLQWADFTNDFMELQIRRQIRYSYGELIVTKTKTSAGRRRIVLPQSVFELLLERKKQSTSKWVFPKKTDQDMPANPNSAVTHLRKILKVAELPEIPFHNLRHTFATQAVLNEVKPETLSNLMGHSETWFTLDTYTHTTVDMQKNFSKYISRLYTGYMEEQDG